MIAIPPDQSKFQELDYTNKIRHQDIYLGNTSNEFLGWWHKVGVGEFRKIVGSLDYRAFLKKDYETYNRVEELRVLNYLYCHFNIS